MKKAWSILLSVLLGAVVVGLGTGYFLHLANQDRENLIDEAQEARAEAIKAQEEREKAILETNQKLTQANQEMERAQEALRLLGLERQFLASAKALPAPSAKLINSWNTIVSAAMGLSLKYPPESTATSDERGINVMEKLETTGNLQQTSDGPWIWVAPYNQQAEQVLKGRLATSTPVAYLVSGRVMAGIKGPLNSSPMDSLRSAAVLSVLYNGSSTHLIWIKNPPKDKATSARRGVPTVTIEDVLATFDFK